jgi:hypothetical protein
LPRIERVVDDAANNQLMSLLFVSQDIIRYVRGKKMRKRPTAHPSEPTIYPHA